VDPRGISKNRQPWEVRQNISDGPDNPLERFMGKDPPQTVPPVEDFYEVLRKHFEAMHEPPFKTLRPIVVPF